MLRAPSHFVVAVITILFSFGLCPAGVPAGERQALLDLYQATDGDNWTDNTNWLGAAGTECQWFGVECHEDEDGVRILNLRINNLVGLLPATLTGLTRLRKLDLSLNQLSGQIPPQIAGLDELRDLFLSANLLSGDIPPELGSMEGLDRIDLDRNQLTTIPPELGNLVDLRRLVLRDNPLGGTIPPELGAMANLRQLFLGESRLRGRIPAELANLANLDFLGLAENDLEGAVPQELAQLVELDEGNGIDLRFNHLYTDDGVLREFLNSKQVGGVWEPFQTLYRYFAQFGDGLGLFSRIVLFNLNQASEATGQVEILGGAGESLSVDLEGVVIEGTRAFNIPAGGLLSLGTDGEGDLVAGSVRVMSDVHVEGVILFGGGNGLAGVGSSPPFFHGFAAPVQTSQESQLNSGIAVTGLDGEAGVAQVGAEPLQLSLLDTGGLVLATAVDHLPANGHKALFVDQIPWDAPVDFTDFTGTLQVTSARTITATVVQTRGSELVTMPVAGLPEPATEAARQGVVGTAGLSQYHYYFAQFADGSGLLSQILLLNLSQDGAATTQVTLNGPGGGGLTVDLNGMEVEGQMPVVIAPAGLALLGTDGVGELAQGSVSVSSDQPLAGVVIFSGPGIGAAGVGSSRELTAGFLAPMQTDNTEGINTGIAVMNLETNQVTLHAALLLPNGTVVATAERILPARGQDAVFVDGFDWSIPVDFTLFEGVVRISASGRIAATVVQTRPGQFATMPVVPLLPAAEAADVIFFNGNVLTMDSFRPQASAVAIEDGEILAVGSFSDVVGLGGRETQWIDLEGKTLMPGIIDPHSHLLATALFDTEQFDQGQQIALAGGVTALADTAVSLPGIETLMVRVEEAPLRLRMGAYLFYNTKCNGITEPEGWVSGYEPNTEDPTQRLRILGIKLFADAGKPFPPYCGWPASQAELPEWVQETTGAGPHGDLVLTAEEMADVISTYQALGFQAVIHVRGDGSLDAALDAIESALDGGPNVWRHRVDHNDLVRPDQIARYGELGVAPVLRVRPNFLGANTCYVESLGGVHPLGEEVQPWARIVRSIIEVNPGLPVAWHSDLGGNFGFARPPMNDLWELVTRSMLNAEGEVCEPTDWLAADAPTVGQALRMMTIDAAYMLFLEEKAGSLEPGKFADMIILSENPLTIDPDDLRHIEVLMTMVGGQVEHCLSGYESLCAGPSGIEP